MEKQLQRTLGLNLVIVMVIGNIIGSGVYKKVTPMAAELHSSGWVLVGWILGGIVSLFGALCNAEVAGLLAGTGGEYVYYKKIYNRFFAFIFGWSLFSVIQTAAISSLAYVFAQSLNSIVSLPPILDGWSQFNILGVFHPFQDFNVKLTAIILIVILTWINSRGIKTGAGFSTVLLLLVFAGLFTIIIFGLGSHSSNLKQVVDFHTSDGSTVSARAMFTAMLAAFWAYQGWASIGYIGGEVKNAQRNLPIGIMIGIFIVIAIYLLANITYLSLLPVTELEHMYKTQNSIAAI